MDWNLELVAGVEHTKELHHFLAQFQPSSETVEGEQGEVAMEQWVEAWKAIEEAEFEGLVEDLDDPL
jgi:hypothetical protein